MAAKPIQCAAFMFQFVQWRLLAPACIINIKADISGCKSAYFEVSTLRACTKKLHGVLPQKQRTIADFCTYTAHRYHLDMSKVAIEQLFATALQYHQAGKLSDAETIYRQILAAQPDHTDALHLYGVIAHQLGRNLDALELIGRAIRINPSAAIYYSSLGVVLITLGLSDEAITAYREAIRLKPDFAEAHNNLGNALHTQGEFENAMTAYQEALRLNPVYAEAQNNLGNALQSLRRFDEAVAAYREAIRLKPDYVEAFRNLGTAQFAQGLTEEAISSYRKSLELDPANSRAHSSLILFQHHDFRCTGRDLYQELTIWNRLHAVPLKKFIQPHTNEHNPDRRLKIGYVSPDFREHVVGWNLLPLLENHDHNNFDIICYSNVKHPDAMTERLRSCADAWCNIMGVDDATAVQMIRDDKIDILVDLAVHSLENRLLLFACKPAPVQVTYLGYPGSTGMDTLDYRLSDPYLDPPETDLTVYSEQTLCLPQTYWCYQPGGPAPDTTSLPALSAGFVTFGCLNKFAKVSLAALDLWIQILSAVPHSRLILYSHAGSHLVAVREHFSRMDISPQRIEFVGKQPWSQYMNTYNRIDIALDPFPYGGGITTCDSLWMGIPVVSLSGQTAVSRAGRSILTNIGLPELIAYTPQEYVDIAVKLSGDLSRLSKLRSTLRQRMQASPLMDAKRFARNIEAAYREMWRKWCGEQM